MEKDDWLEKNFRDTRERLTAIAFRMLGSIDEAEDAVQETWIRLTRAPSGNIENLNGWLTTVVTRVCLDLLRARKSRREEPLDQEAHDLPDEGSGNPEEEILLGESVGSALLIVLDLLTPNERIAFVLHDLFDLSFLEIAPMIDRSEAATRQLASRARRRVRGARAPREAFEIQEEVVSAFLAASREGNYDALIRLLHSDVVLRVDATAIRSAEANKGRGAPDVKPRIVGASHVAATFKGKAEGASLALVNGLAGATWAPGGRPVAAFVFVLKGAKISEIDIVMDPQKLKEIRIEILETKNGTKAPPSPSELIDRRIRELGDWRGRVLSRLRTLIREAAPEVVEEWKWRGVPVWSRDGMICTGETYKNIVKLTFARGAALRDPSGLFNASLDGNTRRAIDIHEGEAIDEQAFRNLVREAVSMKIRKGKR